MGKMDEDYAILMFLLHHTMMGSKVVLTEQRCGPFCWVGESERDFMKKLMYFSTKLVWEPERLSRENNIYGILGCEIA